MAAHSPFCLEKAGERERRGDRERERERVGEWERERERELKAELRHKSLNLEHLTEPFMHAKQNINKKSCGIIFKMKTWEMIK